MIPAIAVSHLSHHKTCQTKTRKASYRLAFRHLWHCEKASFATPNTKNHQPSITSTTQPPDHQPITKTRQESRICAKSLSREKQTCSFRYRLLRKLPLTPTACSAPTLPLQHNGHATNLLHPFHNRRILPRLMHIKPNSSLGIHLTKSNSSRRHSIKEHVS